MEFKVCYGSSEFIVEANDTVEAIAEVRKTNKVDERVNPTVVPYYAPAEVEPEVLADNDPLPPPAMSSAPVPEDPPSEKHSKKK